MSANVCDSMVQWPLGLWLTCECTASVPHAIHYARASTGWGGSVYVHWRDDGTIFSPKTRGGGR